eukprot:s37_g27.t1
MAEDWDGDDETRILFGAEMLLEIAQRQNGIQMISELTATLSQTAGLGIYWDYPPLNRQERVFRRLVVGSLCLVGAASVVLAIYLAGLPQCCSKWLSFLSVLSEVKVVISVVKYCPQVWLNYQRKSTVGWTIYNVLLDFTGGLLSVAQLLLDSWLTSDWSKVSGDPAKLMCKCAVELDHALDATIGGNISEFLTQQLTPEAMGRRHAMRQNRV